jgi:hypothetical protein
MKNHPDELAALCPANWKPATASTSPSDPTIDPSRHD